MKTLESKRLILRGWTLEDAKDLYEYGKNSLVGPNAGWLPHKSIDESIEIIEMFMKSEEVFAIVLKEENKVIGGIGLHKRETDTETDLEKQREMGYVLNPAYWGKGYVPEAVQRVLEFGFSEFDINSIWCCHYDFNNNSKRVIEKSGFKYEFRKEEFLEKFDNKRVMTYCYEMTRENFEKRKNQ